MSDLGARFKELRLSRRLTSTALAKPRYSVSYVSQIERGERNPSADALGYFARRLGVSPQYLSTGVPDDLPLQLRYELEEAGQDIAQDRPGEAERKASHVAESAEQYGLEHLHGVALALVGEALYRQARYDEAIEVFEKARTLDLGHTDRVGTTAGLARSSRALGDLRYAAQVVEDFLQAEGEPKLTSDDITEMQSVLVSIYFEGGDMYRAERAANRALAAIDTDTAPRTEAEAYWHASRVLAERRRWEEALEMAGRARFILERLESRRELARLHTAHAYLCLETNPPRIDEAETNLDRAEALLGDLNMPAELAPARIERGRLCLLRGSFEEAIKHATRALGTEGVETLFRAHALLVLGRALARLERYDEAHRALQDAVAIFESQAARRQLAGALRQIGELHASQAAWSQAILSYRTAFDTIEPLGPWP